MLIVLLFGFFANAHAQVPVITAVSPARQVVTRGGELTLGVTATGAISYQWKRNGLPISGATNTSYTISAAQPLRDNGWYQAVATNSTGSTNSHVMFVNVVINPAQIVTAGANDKGQTTVPSGLTSVVAVSAGFNHSMALKSDGTVVAWGSNDFGQQVVPSGLAEVVAIAAGNSWSLALKSDGTVVGWGNTSVPAGLNSVVALSADYTSLALKEDGTVVGWGGSYPTPPAGLAGVVAIAAGGQESLALKADGTVVAWGSNIYGQCNVPAGLSGVTAIAVSDRGFALKADGTVAAWGAGLNVGQTRMPDGAGGFAAISARSVGNLALATGGTVSSWGAPEFGVANVDVVGISLGNSHALALRDATSDSAPKFIAVGANGTILMSLDGVTWGARVSGTTERLRAVASNAGTIVTAGEAGTILSSSDSVTWTSRTSGTTETLRGVAANSARFVAVGGATSALILTSTDGVTWTSATAPAAGKLRAVAWSGSRFVAVGAGGTVLTSADGVTWTSGNANTTERLDGVRWNAGQFFVVSESGKVLTSSDAITWASTQSYPPTWLEGLAWGDASFVAVGASGRISVSANGSVWASATSGTSATLHGVTWTGVPMTPTGDPALLLGKIDFHFGLQPISQTVATGANAVFSAIASAADATWQWFKNGVAINGATTAAYTVSNAQSGDAGTYAVRATTGGVSVTSSAATLTLRGFGTVGKQFVTVGESGVILTSPDGMVWTSRTSGTTKRLRAAAASGNLIAAVGETGTILTSPDGSVWTTRSSGTTDTLRGVATSPSRFVAVGGAASACVLTSLDGVAWSAATVPAAGKLRAVAWGNGQFVAVGAGGTILTSVDGSTWNNANAGTTARLDGVVYTGDKFVVISATGAVLTSADGIQWSSAQSYPPTWLEGFGWGDIRLVVVGSSGRIVTSTNGNSWTAASSGVTTTLHGVAWTGVSSPLTGDPTTLFSNLGQTPPTVASFTPTSALPGATATITGTGFNSATSVTFNGVAAASFTVVSDTQITAVVPVYATSGAVAVSSAGGVGSSSASLTIPIGPRLTSISTRAAVGTGENALLSNFTVEGGAKTVLIRAAGPSLATFGISGGMADPVLTLYDSTGAPIAANDNWGGTPALTSAFSAAGAFPFDPAGKDAALLITLQPGTYTARVVGTAGTTGVAMIEVYDTADAQRLAYISTRAQASAGSGNVLAGFSLGGASGNQTVLIRAVGTPLVPGMGALSDPILSVSAMGGTQLATNNDWGTNSNAADIATATAAVGAMPLHATDSAVLLSLPSGVYTVQAAPASSGSGFVLVEVFLVDGYRAQSIAPALLAPLQDRTVNQGETVTFNAPSVGKPGPVTYQWKRNGVNVAGSPLAEAPGRLLISSATSANAGTYTVTMTTSAGTTTSAGATLTVIAPPAPPPPPPPPPPPSKFSQTVQFSAVGAVGIDVPFTVSATANSGLGVTYSLVSGNARLTGASVTLLDSGPVVIRATQAGNATYNAATADLTVTASKLAQTITFAALADMKTSDGPLSLAATSSANLPVTFSVVSGPASISGSVLTLSGQPGTVTVRASQPGDIAYTAAPSVDRSFAVVLLLSKPAVTQQPVSATSKLGGSATFAVVATGNPAPVYQWRKNGAAIGGATSATLALTNVQASDAASYDVVVSNSEGSTCSNLARLTVSAADSAPVILVQPRNQTVVVGRDASLAVVATGVPAPTYQWTKNGANIPGATGPTLSFGTAQASDGASYGVTVANPLGTVTSQQATLRVIARSYAGTYFGTFGNAGTFAISIREDNTGVLLGYLTGLQTPFVALPLVADDNGRFHFTVPVPTARGTGGASTPRVAAAAAEFVFDGAIDANGNISGSLTGPVSLPLAATLGGGSSTQAMAGYYQAGSDQSSATAYSIVGSSGQALVLVQTATGVDAGSGTVDANGHVNVTTTTKQTVTADVSVPTATISLSVTTASGTTMALDGGKENVLALQRLSNLSARGRAGATKPIIAGFVIRGVESKSVLIRAVGPSLSQFGVLDVLPQPKLEVRSSSGLVGSNSGWSTSPDAAELTAAAARIGAFPLLANSKDAVILATLPPGSYTAIVGSADGKDGAVLVETYDLSAPAAGEKLINISTRSDVGAGDNTCIVGFMVSGTTPKRVLVRGMGPSLGQFGLGGVAHPRLILYKGAVAIATNQGWSTSVEAEEIRASAQRIGAFGFASDADAAVLINLEPGVYTAAVVSADGSSGVTLAEVYEVP